MTAEEKLAAIAELVHPHAAYWASERGDLARSIEAVLYDGNVNGYWEARR